MDIRISIHNIFSIFPVIFWSHDEWMTIVQKLRLEPATGVTTADVASYEPAKQKKIKLHGLSPRANYTDRATAVSRPSDCQLLRIKGATWSA
jgi:hypothetical protein